MDITFRQAEHGKSQSVRRKHETIFQSKEADSFCSISFDADAIRRFPSVEVEHGSFYNLVQPKILDNGNLLQ